MRNYRQECMIAFEQWAISKGFSGICPDSLIVGVKHKRSLSDDQRNGLHFWAEAFHSAKRFIA